MKINKLKHNKKRNTAFLYEALIKELTISIVEKKPKRKKLIEAILVKFFKKGTNLQKDLDSYKAIYETKKSSLRNAEKLIQEAKTTREKVVDEKELFVEQTSLINFINKKLGKGIFNHFVPNYKSLATISQIFNKNLSVKNRVLLENNLIKVMTVKNSLSEEVKPVDKLTYNIFLNKFNKKYKNELLSEQKKLINCYLISFSDNSASLKIFLEGEIPRLKERLEKAQKLETDDNVRGKLNLVKEDLEKNQYKNVDNNMVLQIMKIQQLASEISDNAI